ncbi:MAG: cytochrome C [Betaproteobacteria bacterium HGW-Betaproteobacteria-11]|nr:MAG: cytochrome C [Betaproteobacteria bacterium HGW-Betaproteobacteria-11]
MLVIFRCEASLAAPSASDPNLGRNLAAICANCHSPNPRDNSAIEPLTGMSKEKIVKKMHAFRNDEKAATLMNQLAKGFSAEQIDLIAGYLSSQGKVTRRVK